MLQQTQVSRVVPRFESFLDRWPLVDNLAEATNSEMLSEWSGLGYNARAIRLRDAAKIVSKTGWPTSVSGLEKLPGVGPYTASAIASISFGVHVPALETNLRRVLSRWSGEALDGERLAEFARTAVGEPAGVWNQAVMDLGAKICLPRSPECKQCPVSRSCADPSIYVAPAGQTRFEGSNRQLRGALVRASVEGEDLLAAGGMLERSEEEVRRAVDELVSEGLIPQG